MNKLLLSTALMLGFTASAANLDEFKSETGKIDIAGGTAHIPVMKQAAQNIMKVNPKIKITVTGGGSGVGVQKVGEGLVEIGNTGRALKETEIEKYGLVSFPFAIDGVAVVVNPQNNVAEISTADLKKIYTGEIDNWKTLGGSDAKITIYAREDGSGTRDTFEELAIDKGETSASANIINSNGAMKSAIAQDQNSIGYVGIGHLNDEIKGIVLDGMVPSQANASNGDYKITRLLYMNTKGEPKGIVKSFIDYIFTEDGAKIIESTGYIPVAQKP